jgi:hypothetical protein
VGAGAADVTTMDLVASALRFPVRESPLPQAADSSRAASVAASKAAFEIDAQVMFLRLFIQAWWLSVVTSLLFAAG